MSRTPSSSQPRHPRHHHCGEAQHSHIPNRGASGQVLDLFDLAFLFVRFFPYWPDLSDCTSDSRLRLRLRSSRRVREEKRRGGVGDEKARYRQYLRLTFRVPTSECREPIAEYILEVRLRLRLRGLRSREGRRHRFAYHTYHTHSQGRRIAFDCIPRRYLKSKIAFS